MLNGIAFTTKFNKITLTNKWLPFVKRFECSTVLVSIVIDILIIIDSVIPVRHIACKSYGTVFVLTKCVSSENGAKKKKSREQIQ